MDFTASLGAFNDWFDNKLETRIGKLSKVSKKTKWKRKRRSK